MFREGSDIQKRVKEGGTVGAKVVSCSFGQDPTACERSPRPFVEMLAAVPGEFSAGGSQSPWRTILKGASFRNVQHPDP